MKNRATKSFLFAGLFLFFASTGVAWAEICAEGDTTCCEQTINKVNWQFKLVGDGPTLITNPDSVPSCGDLWEECYKYRYQITGDGAISQVLLTMPYNSLEKLSVNSDVSDFAEYPPGQGDPTTEFGKNVQEIFVVQIASNQETGDYNVYSNVGMVARATIALKSGKVTGSCAIDGPNPYYGYDPNEVFTVGVQKTIFTSDGREFFITEDPDSECITSAEEVLADGSRVALDQYPLGDVLKSTWYNTETEETEYTDIEFVGKENQRCKGAYAKSINEHSWYFISGRWIWR